MLLHHIFNSVTECTGYIASASFWPWWSCGGSLCSGLRRHVSCGLCSSVSYFE